MSHPLFSRARFAGKPVTTPPPRARTIILRARELSGRERWKAGVLRVYGALQTGRRSLNGGGRSIQVAFY